VIRVDVPRLLQELGVEATRDGSRYLARCPHPAHEDRNPSWAIRADEGARHGSHHCPSCGFGGGPWELVEAVLGLSATPRDDDSGRSDAGDWIFEHVIRRHRPPVHIDDVPDVRVASRRRDAVELALPNGVVIPSVDGSEWFGPALAYLHGRGVPDWQLERWHVGYATRGRCAFYVVVPVHTGGRLVSYSARRFVRDDKPRYDAARRTDPGARPDAAVFGEPAFEPLDADGRRSVAVVTEGVFKALAMERAGAPNPCAILGASNLGPEKLATLATFRVLLVATDPDKAGREAYEQIRLAVCRYSEVRRVPLRLPPDDADDAENERVWRAAMRRRALP